MSRATQTNEARRFCRQVSWPHDEGHENEGLEDVSSEEENSPDHYSRLDYRRLIAWPQRIQRESPFLLEVLSSGPIRRIVDLGSGTGEHSRFLASAEFETVGVDASPEMLEKARDTPLPPNLRFVAGDLADLDAVLEGSFGGAICLGNVLPHLLEPADLAAMFRGLREHLAESAPFLLQILNYDRIFDSNQRTLPVNFRIQNDEEIVFLRLMTPQADGTLFFNPTTLRYCPGEEPPVEVVASKNVVLRGWRRAQLESMLQDAGFDSLQVHGGMQGESYDPQTSSDLVIVAR